MGTRDDLINSDTFTKLTIRFARTLRLPEDGQTYLLPNELQWYPLRFADDFPQTTPASQKNHRSVLLPMHPSDGVWFCFESAYRFAIKIGVGSENVLTGEPWGPGWQKHPQNYLTIPRPPLEQPAFRRYVPLPLDPAADRTIHLEIIPLRAETWYWERNSFFLPPNIGEFFKKVIFTPIIAASMKETKPFDWEAHYNNYFNVQPPVTPPPAPPFPETARRPVPEDDRGLTEKDQSQTICCTIHTYETKLAI